MKSLQDCLNQHLIDSFQYEQLSLFASLVFEWNPRINLTGFKTRPEIEERLIVESVLSGKALGLTCEKVLDFGSGAGIPGLIWAICFPASSVTSVEVRYKKTSFQKEFARQSRLLNLTVVTGRFPGAVSGERYDLIATRAIRFSANLWKEAKSLLSSGGRLVRFGSGPEDPSGWDPLPVSPNTTLFVLRST